MSCLTKKNTASIIFTVPILAMQDISIFARCCTLVQLNILPVRLTKRFSLKGSEIVFLDILT